MADYAWIITKDHLAQPGETSDVNRSGPMSAPTDFLHQLSRGEGAAFRMLDDDGELYYEGRFVGDTKGAEAFGPLDDFGLPDAGCTSIEYRNAAGAWEQL